MNLFKKFRDFIASPSHSRTMGILGMLILVSAVSLTVIAGQQQQTIKQRASGPDCDQFNNDCNAGCAANSIDGDGNAYNICMTDCTAAYNACLSAAQSAPADSSFPQSAITSTSVPVPTSNPDPILNNDPASIPNAPAATAPDSSPANYNSCLNGCLDNYCAGQRSNNPDCDNQYYETCTNQCGTSNPAPAANTCQSDGKTCTDSTGQSFTNTCNGNSYDLYSCINNLCNKSTTTCGPENVCANDSSGPTCQPQAVASAKCINDADCGTSNAYCSNDKKSFSRYGCNLANGKCEYATTPCDQEKSCFMNGLIPTCALITPTPTPTASPTPTPFCSLLNKGDANCDGIIDTVDYGIWQNEIMRQILGTLISRESDFNNDEIVNIEDFNIWNSSRLNL